jgi:hypothetical protein
MLIYFIWFGINAGHESYPRLITGLEPGTKQQHNLANKAEFARSIINCFISSLFEYPIRPLTIGNCIAGGYPGCHTDGFFPNSRRRAKVLFTFANTSIFGQSGGISIACVYDAGGMQLLFISGFPPWWSPINLGSRCRTRF